MRSLLEYLLLEARTISTEEWSTYRIKNQGGITNELKAMLNISTAKELKLDSNSKAKCATPAGQEEVRKSLKLSKTGDLLPVFKEAFQNDNVLSNFASQQITEILILDKPGIQVQLKANWKTLAKKTASSARCIKFWMQSIAISCQIIQIGDSNFEVGIDQEQNLLYIFMK